MSRTKGDPRQALIHLEADAPFVDKATIAICGPDLIDVDYLTLMLATGRLGEANLNFIKYISKDIHSILEGIAGKILIELSKDKTRQKKIVDAIDTIGKTYQIDPETKSLLSWKQNYAAVMSDIINLPPDKTACILQNPDSWDSIELELEKNEDFSNKNHEFFSERISKLKFREDILNVIDEVLGKIKFIKLYMDQAILPIEACILLGARKVNIEKTIRLIQNRSENSTTQQENHGPGLDLSEIPMPYPIVDITGYRFWQSKRLLLREWEEMTDPIFLTKTELRNRITALTGREPSTKDVETSAELIGHKIKPSKKRPQKRLTVT
jgi:hypothetical protein